MKSYAKDWKATKRPALEATVTVSIVVTSTQLSGGKARLRRALKGALVAIKDGPLETVAMGTVAAVKDIKRTEINEYEYVGSEQDLEKASKWLEKQQR